MKPRIGENKFGRESVTYEGVGGTKKWERIESYGPKFVENIVQATARDILMYAMKTLRCYSIVAHVHDELIIEGDSQMSLEAVCEQMGRVPPWAKELVLRADGYVCDFSKIDSIEIMDIGVFVLTIFEQGHCAILQLCKTNGGHCCRL